MTLSDGEKLILLMLSDIHEHLKIKGETDIQFVRSALFNGNLWAMERKFPGIFEPSEPSEEVVTETLDILEMWELIEHSHSELSPEAQEQVTAAAPFGGARFMGFDGNNESEYIKVASCLIDELDRYVAFKGRDLNSHLPMSLNGYQRMLVTYKQLKKQALTGGWPGFTAPELIELLSARRWPKEATLTAS